MAKSPTKFLSYPKGLGKEVAQGQNYVLFNSYESKNAVQKKGLMKSSIALYIPPGSLTITTGQTYQDVPGGATMAAAARGFTSSPGGGDALAMIGNKIGSILQGGADVATGLATRAEAVQNFMSASFGLAKNNHLALAYKGPTGFREHAFTFQFFPKDKTETEEVRQIIEDFHNGSTPRMVGQTGSTTTRLTAPFFSSPRQYDVKFLMGRSSNRARANEATESNRNPYLYRLKRSVITSMTINHDPDSVISFHEDGSPVHSTLTLQLKEIEYVTSSDEVDSDLNELSNKINAQRIQASLGKSTPDMNHEDARAARSRSYIKKR